MDFSNRQNRLVRLEEVSQSYLASIAEKTQNDPFYPSYHIAPPHGLVNDPNGLSFFNGEHHIFYQWFPLGPVHGLKHWYHVSTKDFVNYNDRGVAMVPELSFEEHGCYTGVGVPQQDELLLYYTANRFDEEKNVHQTQALAVMDKQGNLTKKGVVIEENREQYTCEFRDPILVPRTECNFMLVGAQGIDEKGKLAAYKGNSLTEFDYLGNIDVGLDEFGYMWECPNYYEEQDKGIFIFSPQGVTSESKYDLKNVFSVVYMVGEQIDFDNQSFEHQGWFELDKGFDFYAPQTYVDEQDRRILLGWLGNSKSEYPTDKNMWAHMLTLPRELKTQGNRIAQFPLAELEGLRAETLAVTSDTELKNASFELEFRVEGDFSLSLENQVGDNIRFSGTKDELILDRSDVTHPHAEAFGSVRYAQRLVNEQHIRIFVDNSSIEIFADNGLTVFTSRLFIDDLSKLTVAGIEDCSLHYLKPMSLSGDGYQKTVVEKAQA